jgi:hypothetical protein
VAGEIEALREEVEFLKEGHSEFNRAINFALDELSISEVHLFLQAWREGDWDTTKAFGFEPPAGGLLK